MIKIIVILSILLFVYYIGYFLYRTMSKSTVIKEEEVSEKYHIEDINVPEAMGELETKKKS